MNILLTAGIALIGTLVSVFGVYNYLPLDVLQFNKPEQMFGSAITTIAGTDTLSSSRTVINDNFSALNSTKMENSTTSVAAITTLANLSTVGTIGSGIWNGTAIPVLYGGTGTTTPTSNQVIIGNGSSGFKVIGFGTSGQFLTSGGASTVPSWTASAIDQTGNYNWTGTSLFKSLNASSTAANPLVLNGVSINTPSTQGASSTVLSNNGSGTLYHVPLPWLKIGETLFSGIATTTLTLSATSTKNDIRIVVNASVDGTTCDMYLRLNPNTSTGVGANYAYVLSQVGSADQSASDTSWIRLSGNTNDAGDSMFVTIDLNNEASLRKFMSWKTASSQSASANIAQEFGTAVFNDTTNQLKSLDISTWCASGNTISAGRISVYASQN